MLALRNVKGIFYFFSVFDEFRKICLTSLSQKERKDGWGFSETHCVQYGERTDEFSF